MGVLSLPSWVILLSCWLFLEPTFCQQTILYEPVQPRSDVIEISEVVALNNKGESAIVKSLRNELFLWDIAADEFLKFDIDQEFEAVQVFGFVGPRSILVVINNDQPFILEIGKPARKLELPAKKYKYTIVTSCNANWATGCGFDDPPSAEEKLVCLGLDGELMRGI